MSQICRMCIRVLLLPAVAVGLATFDAGAAGLRDIASVASDVKDGSRDLVSELNNAGDPFRDLVDRSWAFGGRSPWQDPAPGLPSQVHMFQQPAQFAPSTSRHLKLSRTADVPQGVLDDVYTVAHDMNTTSKGIEEERIIEEERESFWHVFYRATLAGLGAALPTAIFAGFVGGKINDEHAVSTLHAKGKRNAKKVQKALKKRLTLDTDGDGIPDAVDEDGDGIADQPLTATGTSASTGGISAFITAFQGVYWPYMQTSKHYARMERFFRIDHKALFQMQNVRVQKRSLLAGVPGIVSAELAMLLTMCLCWYCVLRVKRARRDPN